MNRKYIIAILLILASVGRLWAQQGSGDPKRWEKIRAIKVGFINDRLHFTDDQSGKFWAVYGQYEKDRRAVRRGFYQKYKSANPSANPAQARTFVEDNLEYQEQELSLKRKYKDQLLQVISAQQLAQLYEAERDFNKLLLEQLKNQPGE